MINTVENLSWNDWDAIARVIQQEKRFLLTTHVNADPDALGSELALAEALRALQKEPLILNPTPVSENYLFLDPANEIQIYQKDMKLEDFAFDAVFILDISRWERLGNLAEPIRFCGRPKMCIDHHPYTGGYADYHLINIEACATAEIVYDLVNFLGIQLNHRMAECLYTSMLADTGSFSFSNTNARSHKIVAELLSHDVCPRAISERLYQNHSPERLKFLGTALSNLQFDCNQKLAWMTISYDMLQQYGLKPDDVEGFVDLPRNCRNVLLSVLFLEMEPNDVKISLRSKGDFNANRLATKFGGGGHIHASGIRLSGPLKGVEETILSEARAAMQPFL